MTVIVVVATFLVFALLDWLLNREKGFSPALVEAPRPPGIEGELVEGFFAPADRRYHHGHTWLLQERKNLVRAGIDEFGSALAGIVDRIQLPEPGKWVRQGQRAILLHRNGKHVAVASPVEGEVVEVNREVLENPALLQTEPYGRGWLMTVHVPDEDTVTRNLLPKQLVRPWLREAAERLYARQPQIAGAVAADGGRPVSDVATALGTEVWPEVCGEFFLTKE